MATPSHLRQVNQRKVIKALLRLGTASRADLAKATGMSQPTVGKIVEELLATDIFEATGSADSVSIGRPGQLLCLDRRRPRFLAIQLGVSHTRMAVSPVAVQEDEEWTVQIPTAGSPDQWVRSLLKASKPLLTIPPEAVLVSVPGVVDERTGQVLLCPNLRWAETLNLSTLLSPLWDAPVIVVQEIRALALGQLAFETNGGDFLLVDFGDGVGGAAVVGGNLYESAIPLSGELGHTPVLGNERRCGCGAVGCVETLVSRRGLLEGFSAARKQGPQTWTGLVEDIARRGVQPWMASALDAVAVVIAGSLNVLGVRRTVITGSLTELPSAAIEYLSAAVTRGAMWARFGEVTCQGAPRRRMAGLVSAAIDRIISPVADEDTAVVRPLTRAGVSGS